MMKHIFLALFGILFAASALLVGVGIHTADTVIIAWNAVNMFVSAFFFGFFLRT